MRSKTWNYIVNKTQYKIEILYISNDITEIRLKEIEFIQLYGRRDFNNGTLVNHTDGGDGRLNPNKESMINNGDNWRGVYGKFHRNAKSVYQYDMSGKFIRKYDTITSAGVTNDIGHIGIIKNCKKQINYFKNFQWYYKYQGLYVEPCKTVFERKHVKVVKYDLDMNLIKQYVSIKEAVKDNNLKYQHGIVMCCRNQIKTSAGFIWKYL